LRYSMYPRRKRPSESAAPFCVSPSSGPLSFYLQAGCSFVNSGGGPLSLTQIIAGRVRSDQCSSRDPLTFNQRVLGSSPSALTTSNPYAGRGFTTLLCLQFQPLFPSGNATGNSRRTPSSLRQPCLTLRCTAKCPQMRDERTFIRPRLKPVRDPFRTFTGQQMVPLAEHDGSPRQVGRCHQ